MSQRLDYIVEKLKEGDLVEAKELIELELDTRKEIVGKKVQEAITSQLLESNNSKNVKGIGKVNITTTGATLYNVSSISDAVSKAPEFAKFVNGEEGKYTAKASGDTVMISIGGSLKFDLEFDEQTNELNFGGDFSKEELSSFRKNGSLDS